MQWLPLDFIPNIFHCGWNGNGAVGGKHKEVKIWPNWIESRHALMPRSQLRHNGCKVFWSHFWISIFLNPNISWSNVFIIIFTFLHWSTRQASCMHLRHRTSLMSTPWSFWTCIFTLGVWKMIWKWHKKSLGLLCQASWLNPKHCTKLYSDNISFVDNF